jgi:ABC-type lipoprotein export system ATPase subunit
MPKTLEKPAAGAAGVDTPILRCQGIRRAFRTGQEESEVLRHVDLTLRPGEFVAIEGRSGSGKSTLLHILGTLDAADDGFVE